MNNRAALVDAPFFDPVPASINPQKLLQSIVDVICVFDANGLFQYVSPSAEQLFGYTPAELTGQPFSRYIVPEDLQKTIDIVSERIHDCRTSHFENRYYHKDGTLIPVIWSGRWDGVDGLLYCVARNGSEKRELEQRLLKSQHMARVANFEYDIVNNCYTYISDTFFEIFGLEKAVQASFAPDDFWALLHPDDSDRVKEAVLLPEHKHSSTLEFRIIRPDGQLVYLHRLREVVYNAAGKPIKTIGTLQDITIRKKAEQALEQSEQRLQYLVQNGNDLIGIIDAQGYYRFVGANVGLHLGYGADELVGRSALEFIHPDDLALVSQGLQEIQDKPFLTVGPFRFRNAGGEWRWVETTVSNHLGHPSIQGLVTNSRDITEKKLKEDQLKLSEQRFKALVYNGSDLIVIMDEGACFSYISDNVSSVLGYTPDDLLGKNAFDYIHPDDSEKVRGEVAFIIQNQEAANGIQHRFRNKEGEWVWMESTGSNHLGNERIQGILVNSRTIDERIKLQRKLDQELMNKQKEITSAVIRAQETERSQLGLELHDNVNQVLTTVKLYNELYLSGHVQDIELLRKSTQYLQDCINEIRSISKRLSAPTLGKISLKDSISELVSSINLTKRIEVSYRTQGIDHCNVSEDLHLSIYRIVQESLNNAIKYSGAKEASVAIRRHKGKLCLQITDNGKGFDTTASRQGIGITNMRTRAEHLNASFQLVSEPGNGCSILICFPVEEAFPSAALFSQGTLRDLESGG
jgi:PAS domain S-box-containing protein